MIIHILLPNCTRSHHNVFFNILKNVVFRVGRAKLTEHFLDNAFKDGMMAKPTRIDFIVAESWNSSKRDQIALWRLLGNWASRYCPLFGKVLFGDNWQTTDSADAPDDDLEKFVLSNMKCVLVELNISESTLPLLKHFVQVPLIEIGIENTFQISPKMKLSDIDTKCWEKCWASLKGGKWLGIPHEEGTFKKDVRGQVVEEIGNSQPLQARVLPLNSDSAVRYVANYTASNFSRKRPHAYDLTEVAETQIVKTNVSLVNPVTATNDVGPIDLSTKESDRNGQRSMEQLQCQSVEPANVVPLNLTICGIGNESIVSDTTTTTMHEPFNKKLHERVQSLQDELLLALQRELTQKNSLIDERNETLHEAQKMIVALQLQLIEKSVSNQRLQQQVDELNSSLAENEDTNRNLQLQLNARNESIAELHASINAFEAKNKDLSELVSTLRTELSELEHMRHNLQLQLTAKSESIAELSASVNAIKAQKKELSEMVTTLRSELSTKDESLLESKMSSSNLQHQLTTQIESAVVLQDLINQLTKEKNTLTEAETAVRFRLASKDQSLGEMEQANHILNLQLNAKNESIAELEKSIDVLQLEVTTKNKSLIELGKLKDAIEETIRSLESEISDKSNILCESNRANQSLQLQLSQKNASLTELQNMVAVLRLEIMRKKTHEVILPTSKVVPGEVVKQPNQPKQHSSPDVLPITFEGATKISANMDQSSEAMTTNNMIDHTLEAKQDDESGDPTVQLWRESLSRLRFGWIRFNKYEKFRPGFVHPPDADGIVKAQEINSDGYPCDEKVEFKMFKTDIADSQKLEVHTSKVKIMNEKFNFDFK